MAGKGSINGAGQAGEQYRAEEVPTVTLKTAVLMELLRLAEQSPEHRLDVAGWAVNEARRVLYGEQRHHG